MKIFCESESFSEIMIKGSVSHTPRRHHEHVLCIRVAKGHMRYPSAKRPVNLLAEALIFPLTALHAILHRPGSDQHQPNRRKICLCVLFPSC